MSETVHIRPVNLDFVAERHESILDAALRAGLAVDYGCSSGSCGLCKARLLQGEVQPVNHADYVISEAEKSQGYFLLCSNAAVSDIEIDVPLASNVAEIPQQTLITRVRKYEMLSPDILSLRLRTPRSQRLRFIAGQHATLALENGLAATLPVASCPCDGMQLEFHMRRNPDDAFMEQMFHDIRLNDAVTVSGPHGSFVLQEDDPRPLFLIAYDTGFAAIRSLTEHIISRELKQPILLFWLTPEFPPYAHNYCRSVSDAIDNITYVAVQADNDYIGEALEEELANFIEQHHAIQIYAAASQAVIDVITPVMQRYVHESTSLWTDVIYSSGRPVDAVIWQR